MYLGSARLIPDCATKQALLNKSQGRPDQDCQRGVAPEEFTTDDIFTCGLRACEVVLVGFWLLSG